MTGAASAKHRGPQQALRSLAGVETAHLAVQNDVPNAPAMRLPKKTLPLCTAPAAITNFALDERLPTGKSVNVPLQETFWSALPGPSFVLVSVCGFSGQPSRVRE